MSTYRLGTVAFAVLGVWLLAWALNGAVEAVEHFVRLSRIDAVGELGGVFMSWISGELTLGICGVVLFAGREPMSRRLFGEDEIDDAGGGPSPS